MNKVNWSNTCKGCDFAQTRQAEGILFPVLVQMGCEAGRLDKINHTEEWFGQECFQKLERKCNLYSQGKTLAEAKRDIKIDPLAIVLMQDGYDIVDLTSQLTAAGFKHVALAYRGQPQELDKELCENSFETYRIVIFVEDESDDWMIDQAVEYSKNDWYCTFQSNMSIPFNVVNDLNKLFNEDYLPVLMIRPNKEGKYKELHGFTCFTKLHKKWGGNMPSQYGLCLEEKIWDQAVEDGETKYVFRWGDRHDPFPRNDNE